MNYLDQEKRADIFIKANYVCEACGNDVRSIQPQLGHRINQSKVNLKKYGEAILHHELNLAPTCSNRCNAKVSLYGKYTSIDRLVARIKKELKLSDIYANG